MGNLYYQMKDGRYIQKRELEEAFYIQHPASGQHALRAGTFQ